MLTCLFSPIVFEMCYELEDGTGLYGYQSHPLLSDNSCPVAMKRVSEMPCKRDEYPSVTAERFFCSSSLADLSDQFSNSAGGGFECCHTII